MGNVSAERNNPSIRMNHAFGELYANGRFAESLDEFMWCFDHGLEHDPDFYAPRISFLIGYWGLLAKKYPPALESLELRRDRVEHALLMGTASKQEACEYASINRHLDDNRRTLATFDRLDRRDPQSRWHLFSEVFDLLLEARRYANILATCGHVKKEVDRAIGRYEETKTDIKNELGKPTRLKKRDADLVVTFMRGKAVETGGKFYEALLGAKYIDEAAKLADHVIEFHASGATFATLIRHAVRAGQPMIAQDLKGRGKSILPKEEHPPIDEVDSMNL